MLYRDIAATGPARTLLQEDYRRAAAAQPVAVRLALAARTWLEAALLSPGAGSRSGWQTLAGAATPGASARLARRAVVALVLVLTLLVALVLARRPRPTCARLFGGMLAVLGAALLAANGGVGDLVLWAPLALAVTAATPEPAARATAAATADSAIQTALRPVPPGPAPRITVER